MAWGKTQIFRLHDKQERELAAVAVLRLINLSYSQILRKGSNHQKNLVMTLMRHQETKFDGCLFHPLARTRKD